MMKAIWTILLVSFNILSRNSRYCNERERSIRKEEKKILFIIDITAYPENQPKFY